MTVLADAHERHVHGLRTEGLTGAAAHLGHVSLAVQQQVVLHLGLPDEAFEDVLPEAGGVIDRQPDVFVEVEERTRSQSTPGLFVNSSRNSNCDAPVATTMRAPPRSVMARRMTDEACAAAALAISNLVSNVLTIIWFVPLGPSTRLA